MNIKQKASTKSGSAARAVIFSLKSMAAVLFVLSMVAGSNTYSQTDKPPREKPSPEKMAQRIADKLDKELDLTDNQHTQVYDIVKSYMETHTKENFSRDELHTQIKGVLTSEQQTKFDEMSKNMDKKKDGKWKKESKQE